jgi:hypothetical protein
MALVNLTFEQRKWIHKCYWKTENVEYPPRSPDLTPSHFFLWGALKECCLHLKTTCTAWPETWNWNYMCRCSISNNTERLPICCTSLSTMQCCWWWAFWTFVTLNMKTSQFYLYYTWITNVQSVYKFLWDAPYIKALLSHFPGTEWETWWCPEGGSFGFNPPVTYGTTGRKWLQNKSSGKRTLLTPTL